MVDAILGVLGMILYPLFSILFLFLDILQDLFYSFAGIGTVYYGNGGTITGTGTGTPITGDAPTGAENDTGLLYYLFNSSIVKNILISMMILALFLLIIFTTLAFIKSIYAEKPKSWKDILSSAVKGLVNFIVLPVCCLLGVWVGNIILQAVNGATSNGGASRLSRKLFICVSYNANKYRGSKAINDDGAKINEVLESKPWLKEEIGIQSVEAGQSQEYYAEIVDQMFSSMSEKGENLGITWYWDPVSSFYRLYDINYIMLIIGGVFMMYVMINVTYGMIKRLFILLMLFVVSPALCALYPLDDGNAVKSWSGDVKKNILSAYGAVAGMNLLFSFLPIVQNIKISFGWAADVFFINNVVQLILMICALFCMNDFISMISGYIGAGNAFADGKSLRGSAKGAIQKQTKKVGNVAGAFVRANAANEAGGGAKAFIGSLAKSATGGVQKSLGLDWGLKEESEKGREEYYKSQDSKFKAMKAEKDRQKDEMQEATDNAFYKSDKQALKRDLEEASGDKAEQKRLKQAFRDTHGYHYTNEAEAVDQILRFKSDDLRKREAYKIAEASNGEISGEKLYNKAKAEDATRKTQSASGVADALTASRKEEQTAQRTYNFSKLQVEKLESLESDLAVDGRALESTLGHSMLERKVSDEEMSGLTGADKTVAERYNANFDAIKSMPSREILEENIKEAGKALASASTNMQVQMNKLADKMGVTLAEAIETVGNDLSKLDEALQSADSLSPSLKKFVEELDKSRKKMKDGDK